MFGIAFPEQWRDLKNRSEAALMAAEVVVKPWVPSEEKKSSITSEVSKNETK